MDARAAHLARGSLALPAWLPCGLPFCGTVWQQMVRVTTRSIYKPAAARVCCLMDSPIYGENATNVISIVMNHAHA